MTVEIQDELKEELNRVIEEPKAELPYERKPEDEGDVENEDKTTTNDTDVPKFDPNDPVFKAGSEHMQKAMQKAMDKRIAKEVARRKTIENDYQALHQRIEAIEKTNVAPKPKLSEFNTEDEYDNALLKWNQSKTSAPTQKKVLEPINTPEAMSYTQQEFEYSKNHPEYYQDLEDLNPFLTENLRECLFDAGPAVTHYLTQNLDVADKIARLSPAKLGRAIGLIETSFKKEMPLPKKAEAKPKPAEEVRGSVGGYKDISKMTQSEYNKYMQTI